jgi:membrane-bound ClpP family serine protease
MRINARGVAIMLIGTVLLIFDLVIGRQAALIVAGVTLLVVIIIAALPPILRSNDSPLTHKTVSARSAEGDDHARQEEAWSQCQGREGL